MSSGSQKRNRSERVAALGLPPGKINRLVALLRERDVLIRLAMCAGAALLMWLFTSAWAQPFYYRATYVPPRDIIARVDFSVVDEYRTNQLRDDARRNVVVIYQHDPKPIVELQQALKGKVFQILRAPSFDDLAPDVKDEFFSKQAMDGPSMGESRGKELFEQMRKELEEDQDLAKFEQTTQRALADLLTTGFLETLHPAEQGTLTRIMVHPVGNDNLQKPVAVEEVRIDEMLPKLQQKVKDQLQLPATSDRVAHWVTQRLKEEKKPTLSINEKLTKAATDKAVSEVAVQRKEYKAHEAMLAPGGIPIGYQSPAFELLKLEYETYRGKLSWTRAILHTLADFGMYIALYVLCGFYIYYQQPRLITDFRRFATLLVAVVVTVGIARLTFADPWRAETVPLVLFAMTVAIAYRHEVALILSAAVVLIVVISLGLGLADFTTLLATMAASILLLGRIRSRTKLLYVGLAAGGVAALTAIGVGLLTGHGFGTTLIGAFSVPVLVVNSLWIGFYALIAGLLMTGLLPFMEKLFDVQTDLSLLELGDASHPLLQELVRRAPGTYNHSINVASIAEAAAEAIGANGLLCRVGAYFHDIGKMLKPGYFVENQSGGGNRHESLVPAMSTLVIIAHVKDGADLARQHGLPQSIIDFIQQHHGTTLVEYFYRRASQQCENDPDASRVEESDFRYPGPKPQTREAAVMMLADAVESACRTLVEPTPSRIESLVNDIAMKRLLDGQFAESGLTLTELRNIEESLVKSLTAVYHARVKYPNQQTA